MINNEINVGDIVEMKKAHPCGGNTFKILRIGMDFKIQCTKCGHEIMVQRKKVEKNVKKVIST